MTQRKPTNRDKAKARTRVRLLAKSRELFTAKDYHAVTIRDIARSMRMTTGVVFAHFPGKAELFEAAMGFPPPVDGPLTRAAPMLLEALHALTRATCYTAPPKMINGVMCYEARIPVEFVDEAIQAMTLATSPLDGEAWARHLSSIRRDEPHTLAAGEADPLASSGGSAA